MNEQTWTGEVPMSRRAIAKKDLVDFFEKNNMIDWVEVQDWNSEYRRLDELSNWGAIQRLMMQAIYLITFTCLLRFDEVLKIQHHHIEVVNPGYEATSGFSSTSTRFTFRFPVLLGGDFDPVLPAPGMSSRVTMMKSPSKN
jgi:hypothetical protein